VVIAVTSASNGWIPQIREKCLRSGVGDQDGETRKAVRWSPGEGLVGGALTSCEFRQLKQVLRLASELRQKIQDKSRGMMEVKTLFIGGCQPMTA